MSTFRITVAYDGAEFVGWQRQPNGPSIQGLLEGALGALDAAPVAVTGAGRTDAGVHALGQVASFQLSRAMEPQALLGALNARLPVSVRVTAVAPAADDFNARFAARTKTYRYQIWEGAVLSPFVRRCCWHVSGALDVTAMDAAARRLLGRRDFAAFQSSGSSVATTERTITRSHVREAASGVCAEAGGGRLIVYDVTGDGFLRHMVRAIAGSLVEVGLRRRPAAWVDEVMAAGDRGLAGPTAPPQGLFLVRVEYNSDLEQGSAHVA